MSLVKAEKSEEAIMERKGAVCSFPVETKREQFLEAGTGLRLDLTTVEMCFANALGREP
jgi:hypothetical protein